MSGWPFGHFCDLPPDARDLFRWLYTDIVWLHLKWHVYKELFVCSANVSLLSDMASATFQVIEESLRFDLTVGMCRLRDPATMSDYQNVSLDALLMHCSDTGESRDHYKAFKKVTQRISTYRNKRVGHADLDAKLSPETVLPDISKDDVDEALRLASEVLRCVYRELAHGEFLHGFRPLAVGRPEDLIGWLRSARDQGVVL